MQIVAVPIGCGEILQGSNISTGRPAAVKSEKQIYIQSGKVRSSQKLLDAAKCKKIDAVRPRDCVRNSNLKEHAILRDDVLLFLKILGFFDALIFCLSMINVYGRGFAYFEILLTFSVEFIIVE